MVIGKAYFKHIQNMLKVLFWKMDPLNLCVFLISQMLGLANQNQNQLNLSNHRFLLVHPIDCSFHTNKEQLTGKLWYAMV